MRDGRGGDAQGEGGVEEAGTVEVHGDTPRVSVRLDARHLSHRHHSPVRQGVFEADEACARDVDVIDCPHAGDDILQAKVCFRGSHRSHLHA